jgi:hypothetical protein
MNWKPWNSSHCIEVGLFSSPTFASTPALPGEADVFDHPIDSVAKGGEKEKAWEKQAKQETQNKNQGMDAQSANTILCLPQ